MIYKGQGNVWEPGNWQGHALGCKGIIKSSAAIFRMTVTVKIRTSEKSALIKDFDISDDTDFFSEDVKVQKGQKG